MNKKIKKLINNPKAYFYDYFRKQVRNHPHGVITFAIRTIFANAKTDLGYGKEINMYLKIGELNQAEKICLEGLMVVPKAIRPYVQYAEISMLKNDFEEAIKRWNKIIEQFPNKAEGYAGEARTYARLGDFEHDEILCRTRIKNMPHEFWPYIELAEISMRQGEFNEAIIRWKDVRKRFPDKAIGYIRASIAYCEIERFQDAENLCKRCLDIFPNDIRAFIEYAEISMRKKDYNEALSRWQIVRNRFPNKAPGYIRASNTYCALERFQDAIVMCKTCMESVPKDISSVIEYAEISMRKKDFKEALTRWGDLRERYPNQAQGYVRASIANCEIEKFLEAENLCRQCMEILPNDVSAFAEFAEISMRKCNYEEATNRWKIVVDKFQYELAGYRGLATTYFKRNELFKAEEVVQLAINTIKTPKWRIDLYYLLTAILIEQGGRGDDLINVFKHIACYNKSITHERFYGAICGWGIRLFKLGNIKKSNKEINFILNILLNQQIKNNKATVWLNRLHEAVAVNEFSKIYDLRDFIDAVVIDGHLDSLVSKLAFSKTSTNDRIDAHFQILEMRCFIFNTKLCALHDQNQRCLYSACEKFIKEDKYKELSKFELYDFVLICIFSNQNMADDFIKLLSQKYSKENIAESDPMGFLCKRHLNRTKLVNNLHKTIISNKSHKLNIAVCISGQLRGYKDNLFDLVQALELESHNYKVFVHTWRNIGLNFPTRMAVAKRTFSGSFLEAYISCFKKYNNLDSYLKDNYKNFYNLISESSFVSEDELKNYYNTPHVIVEDDESGEFESFSNSQKMYYKILAAHHLAKQDEVEFDLEIRIRPDLHIIPKEHIDLFEVYKRSKNNASVFTARGLSRFSTYLKSYFTIDDFFAIGTTQIMDIYADTYKNILERAKNNTYDCIYEYAGGRPLRDNILYNGIHVEQFLGIKNVIEVKVPFKNPTISIHDIYSALCLDVDSRPSCDSDKYLLEACKKDMKDTINKNI